MAAGNQVTITFAGEDKPLTDSFNRVGGAARQMGDQVREAGSGFDRAGEAADTMEGRAQGFASTLTGTKDTALGFSQVMKGNVFEGLVMSGQGLADLAEGLNYTVIPLAKMAFEMGVQKVAMAAHAVQAGVTAGATKVWAAAQWILNGAFLASPITWIVLGILLLVGVIVLIATKTDWFQKAWGAAWGWIKSAASNVWDWLSGLPDRIGSTFARVAGFISAPFRAAFNMVSDAWNNTVGRLSWSVPGWVPGIGGNTISAPRLPRFHAGGIVPGPPGSEMMAILQAGERVSTPGGSGGSVLEVRSDGTRMADLFVEVLAHAVQIRGGDVQLVLGTTRG